MQGLFLAALLLAAGAPVARRQCPYIGAVSARADGTVLFRDGADRPAYPASVTKLMTALIVLEDVAAGRYTLDDVVSATPDTARSEPSWVGLKTGDRMSVRDLLLATLVESANDAAIALGVNAAGSLAAFVERMNARARELGMASTRYYNPNGLPPNQRRRYPWKEFNVTTAMDQMRLAVQLLKTPRIFDFTSVKTCDLVKTADGYRVNVTRAANKPLRTTGLKPGETLVKQLRNHNNVMRVDALKVMNPDGSEAVDGLKTGYIAAGGSSIVLTGSRGGKRAIVVVLGSGDMLDEKKRILRKSSAVRDENARRLLSDALGAMNW